MAKKDKKGVIYILTNPSFPDYIKIGYTSDLEKRLKQLNRSETIPFAFRTYAIYEVDSALTDKELHKLIDTLIPGLRTIETFNGKERVKEFYAMSAEEAYRLLECVAKISGTQDQLKRTQPEKREVINEQITEEVKETERRGPFRFSECGIMPGCEIVYIEDPNVRPIVVDDRHIEYQGEITSVSALAQKLKGFDHHIRGTLWFTYHGEIINDIRMRMEKNKTK